MPARVKKEVLKIRIGTYTVGVTQSQLAGKGMRSIQRIIATCVEEGDLDTFSMCGLGGYSAGLETAGFNASELGSALAKHADAPIFSTTHNYMTAWQFNVNASQLRLKPLLPEPEVIKVACEDASMPPQLVVHIFSVDDQAILVHGNMRIPTVKVHENKPTAPMCRAERKLMVQDAIMAMQICRRKAGEPVVGAEQPVVYVLVGDTKMQQEEAEEAVQCLQPVDDHDKWDHDNR